MSSALLPPNSTPFERDAVDATERTTALAVLISDTWNPQSCPVQFLPWLAWSVSVDEWNEEWTEQQKRDVIAASFGVHQKKGTVGAVKRSLGSLGYPLRIVEWFNTARLDPYTFEAEITVNEQPVVREIYTEITRLVENSKNARSAMVAARVITKQTAQIYAGAATSTAIVFGAYEEGGFALDRNTTLAANFGDQLYEVREYLQNATLIADFAAQNYELKGIA